MTQQQAWQGITKDLKATRGKHGITRTSASPTDGKEANTFTAYYSDKFMEDKTDVWFIVVVLQAYALELIPAVPQEM